MRTERWGRWRRGEDRVEVVIRGGYGKVENGSEATQDQCNSLSSRCQCMQKLYPDRCRSLLCASLHNGLPLHRCNMLEVDYQWQTHSISVTHSRLPSCAGRGDLTRTRAITSSFFFPPCPIRNPFSSKFHISSGKILPRLMHRSKSSK